MQEDLVSPDVLGEILKNFGLLNDEQLRLAKERSTLEDVTLRDAILWFNFLSDEELGKVVADHFQIPFVSLFQKEIDDTVLRTIPEVVARSQRIIAFGQDVNGLHVALADPRNTEIIEFIRRKTGMPVVRYYATDRDVTEALHCYAKGVSNYLKSFSKPTLINKTMRKATTIICRLALRVRSQFFHSLRHFSSQEKLLSTTQRFGITTKVCNSFRLAISVVACKMLLTASANGFPVYPPSAKIFFILLRCGWLFLMASMAPSRSVTLAVVTARAWGSPLVSTRICRLMPDTFFPAS